MTEIKLAKSTHQKVDQNDVQCMPPSYEEQQQSFGPLANIAPFLADHVPATVQELF